MTKSNVLPLPLEHSTFSQAWDALPKTMKQRSEGLSILKPLWGDHAKRAGGQNNLLGSLLHYLRACEDIKRSGGPGLGPWLRQRRYELWMQTAAEPTANPSGVQKTPFPEPYRATTVARMGEGWVSSWLDICTLDGTTVVAPYMVTINKLREHAVMFRAMGLTGMRKRDLTAN